LKEMAELTSLCVFCGAHIGTDPAYKAIAADLGQIMAKNRVKLVFGGGRIGLMGVLADALIASGGESIGIIPEFLREKGLSHQNVTDLIVVDSMHERKGAMFQRGDAFCALPGGLGTMEELFEIVTWRQLHIHHKPIILLNVAGYFDPLLSFWDTIISKGFSRVEHRHLVSVVERSEQVIPQILAELEQPKPIIPMTK